MTERSERTVKGLSRHGRRFVGSSRRLGRDRAAAGALRLGIGKVIEELLPEFPALSISKIRYLEDQGLLEPERTPSGYRKYSYSDVERLRFILRQDATSSGR